MADYEFLSGDDLLECQVEKEGESFISSVGDKKFEIQPLSDGLFRVKINGVTKLASAVRSNGTVYVDIDSVLFELTEPSSDGFAGGAGDHGGAKDKIFAPMPGKIVKLLVEVGDNVEPKQQVVIVEAMKMENPVMCRAKGKVKAVNFTAGDQVDTDSPIIELEIAE